MAGQALALTKALIGMWLRLILASATVDMAQAAIKMIIVFTVAHLISHGPRGCGF